MHERNFFLRVCEKLMGNEFVFFIFFKNKKADKIVLTGSGPTVTKTITCAEIIKRKTKVSHRTSIGGIVKHLISLKR